MKAPLVLLLVLIAGVTGAVSGGLVATLVDEDGTTTAIQPPDGREPPELPNIPLVIEEVRESVVSIEVTATVQLGPRTAVEESAGTGFVLSADGMIATNAHVVSGAQKITVTFSDGATATATLVGSDTRADMAVIRVARTGLTPLAIGSSADMRVGDMVMAIGNALALEGGPTVSLGIISAKDRTITAQDGSSLSHLIQTDAAINEGDSGGPLVNASGKVIGINTISASEAQNIGFAIAIDEAMEVIDGLIDGG
ncbi:MAG TPA: trypsin-like peptidase domain-containing protein [Dehalococcoidia bacterium]